MKNGIEINRDVYCSFTLTLHFSQTVSPVPVFLFFNLHLTLMFKVSLGFCHFFKLYFNVFVTVLSLFNHILRTGWAIKKRSLPAHRVLYIKIKKNKT